MTPAVQTENGSKFKKRMNRKYTLVFCVIYWISGLSRVKAQHLKLGVFLESEENYFRRLNSTQLFFDFEIIRVNQSVTPYQTFNDLLNDVEKFRKLAITALIGNYSFLGSVLSAELNIPYYVLNLDQNSAHKRNMFEVDFSDNVLADAYKAIINYNSYENILIITDSFHRSNLLTKFFTGRFVNSLVLINDYTDLENNLVNARGSTGKAQAFILGFDDKNKFMIDTVFKKTLFLDLMNSLNLWLISDLFCDPKYLLPFARSVANIVTFAVANTTLSNPSVLREAILRDSFVHLTTAFKNKSTNSLVDQVRKTKINGYSSDYMAFDGNGKRIKLNLNLMAPRNSLDRLIKIGEFVQDRTPYPYFNTYNGALLRDMNVRIGVYSKKPFFYVKKNGQWDGFVPAVFRELSKQSNFKFTYVNIPDNSIGIFNNITKTWNGAMSMLQNNQIDICGIPGSKNNLRMSTQFSDFSDVVLDSGYNILVNVFKTDELDFIKLFTPFSWFVWFVIIILGIFMTFVLWLIDKISPNDGTQRIYTFADAGFVVFGAFVMATVSTNPRKLSARMFFLILRLGSLLILACYAANFTGNLINPVKETIFSDLKTLYGNGGPNGYKWIFRNGSAVVSNLLDSGGVYADLVTYARKNWPNSMFVGGDNDAIINVLTSDKDAKTVFINDGLENDFLQYTGSQNCLVKTVGNYETDTSLVFYMRNDMPQIDLLKQEIQNMIDSKLIGKYREMYFKAGICTTEHIESIKIADSLSIKSYVGIFILLGIGLIFSLVVVFFEFTINKISLCIQRTKYSKLEFGSSYECHIVGIEENGIIVQLPTVPTVKNIFVSVKNLGNIGTSKQSIEESGFNAGKKINLIYRGNDPLSGAKIFSKI